MKISFKNYFINLKSLLPSLIFCSVMLILCFFTLFFYIKYEKSEYSAYSIRTIQIISNQYSRILESENSEKSKISLMKNFAETLIDTDKNIMAIQFTDRIGNVVIAEKSAWYDSNTFDGIKVTTSVNCLQNGEIETVGYIHSSVSKKYNNKKIIFTSVVISLIYLFILLMFLVLQFIVKINNLKFYLVLKDGLKNILSGKFGMRLDYGSSNKVNEIISLFNDLSQKLKEYEEQNVENILLERNKFEAILMGILNGVVVCDNNDEVVLMNGSAEKILSVSNEVLVNVQIQKFRDSVGNYPFRDKIEEFKDIPLEQILNSPPEYTLNINDKVIKCIISPMFMKNDDYVGYIMVLTDITRETEVNNMKNQFISNVSHELRTPVTVLRTYLDTLNTMSDDLDEDTKKEFIATADKEVARLHRMVNDILDVSRLESPDVEVEKEVENIVPVLEDTITSMQVLANEKAVNILFEKVNDIPDIPFNKPTMERVFNNLLSNAIKYSPQNGKIVVAIKNDSQYVDISVKDEGPGIEAKHLPKLFDRFYRAENNVHTVKGTGLGLYLVKTTVEKHHNGQVYVDSTIGDGSTFGIKLPIS